MNTSSILTTVLTAILALATGGLSWYLLELLAANTDLISSTAQVVFKVCIAIGVLAIILLTVKIAKSRYAKYFEQKKIEDIIEKAAVEPELTRNAIIRLRAVLDPKQHKLADSLATLLDQLLSTIDNFQKEREQQHKTNVELSEKHQQLSKAHEQLRKAPRLRSEFISRMGDEITRPMKSLEEMLNLLNKHDLDRNLKELVTIATHSAHSLVENITNVIEFNKLDANLYQLSKAHVDTKQLLRDVLLTQETIALSKSLMIETEIRSDVPETINTNEMAVKKVLSNIVSNAIRFTTEGSITVKLDMQYENDHKLLRFLVVDTGVGIPEKAIDSIFDSLDKDTDLKNSSFTGRLRMIVSKQLCEHLGGNIGVTSVEGQGSTFWFTVDIS